MNTVSVWRKPHGKLTGLPSGRALRYSPLGRPGGLLRRAARSSRDASLLRIGALMAAVALAGCGGGGSDSPDPAPAPAPPPSGTAAQCYDLSPAEGKTIDTNFTTTTYDTDGSVKNESTRTETSVVGRLATFEGHTATEVSVVGSSTTNGSSQTINYTGRAYSLQTGAAQFTYYGFVTDTVVPTGPGTTAQGSAKTVYTPPLVDDSPGLEVGQTFTFTTTLVQTLTLDGVPRPPITDTQTHTVRFAGVEPLTIAAGTFQACKFEQFAGTGTSGTPSEQWLLLNHGTELKYIEPGAAGIVGDFVREVTSILVDGSVPR